ncbi:MAG: DUF4350 domain-containing protein [Pseudomonadota bacterium]
MRQHLVSVLLACGALLLFWALLFPKPVPRDQRAPRPLSTEIEAAGYAGMSRWLQASGVPVASLRHRFDDLGAAEFTLPGTGNLLVTTLPEAIPLREAEFEAIDSWVRAGNTLLVIAGMDDTPAWDGDSAPDAPERLARLAHLGVNVVPRKDQDVAVAITSVIKAAEPMLLPVAEHPVNQGVQQIVTKAEGLSLQFEVKPTDAAPVLVLAKRADTGRAAIWLRPRGAGAIIVSAWASPFANGQLGKGDNARWLSQLVGWSLGERGVVVFDDMHQGASVYYDAESFFRDPRLKHTLLWLVALWFAWVLGMRVMRPAPAARPPLDDTAMLRVTGGFLAHVLKPADAAAELYRHFFNLLRRRLALPENGEPLWDWLGAQARLDAAALAHLHGQYERVARGKRVDLVALRNTLHDLTGRLA